MKISYGTYVFPVDTEKDVFEWTVSVDPVLDNNGIYRIQDKINWSIKGLIQGSNLTDINTKLNNFKNGFAGDGKDLKLLDDSNNVVQQLLASNSVDGGPHIKSYEAPSVGLEGLYTTNFQFSIELSSTEKVTSANNPNNPNQDDDVLTDEFTITISFDQDLVETHNKRGKITTKSGASAKKKANAAVSSFNPSIQQYKVKVSQEVSHNDTDTEANYSVIYKKLWAALPNGVTSGETTTSTSFSEGLKTVVLGGSYTGSGAMAAALAKKPSGKKLTRKEIKESPDENNVDFTYEYTESESGENIISKVESVSIRIKRNFKDHKIKRVGVRDYRQLVGNPDYFVRESGEIRAKRSYASAPQKLFDETNMEEESINKDFKRGAEGDITEYITKYERSYKLLTPQSVTPRS